MAIPTPQQGAANWNAGVTANAGKWAQNIQSTQKDQAALAVAQQAALVANFNAAVQSGQWASAVQRGGTAYWKSQSLLKQANYAGAATTGQTNYERAASQLYPYEAQLASQIDTMPSGTAAAAKARVGAWIDGMIAIKGQFRV